MLERLVPQPPHDRTNAVHARGMVGEPLLQRLPGPPAIEDDAASEKKREGDGADREPQSRPRGFEPCDRRRGRVGVPAGRRFDPVAPVELERLAGPVPLLGDAGELEERLRRAGLRGAAPRAFGLRLGMFRRVFLVQARELFARRGPGRIHADRTQKRGLGGGEIAAPPVDRRGELGRLRERRIEPLRLGEKGQRGAEGLEVAGLGKDLRLAPAVDGLGGRLVRAALADAAILRSAAGPADQGIAQRGDFRALRRRSLREIPVEALERARRIAELGVPLCRDAEERGLARPESRRAVGERESLLFRPAVRLRPEEARERADRLDAVGLGRQRVARRLDRGGRLPRPGLDGREREERFGVTRRELQRQEELRPRVPELAPRERALAVGQSQARFGGRPGRRRRDRRGARLELELANARADPGRRLALGRERAAQPVVALDGFAPAAPLLGPARQQVQLARRKRSLGIRLGGRREQVAPLLEIAGGEGEIRGRKIEGRRPPRAPRRAQELPGARDRGFGSGSDRPAVSARVSVARAASVSGSRAQSPSTGSCV